MEWPVTSPRDLKFRRDRTSDNQFPLTLSLSLREKEASRPVPANAKRAGLAKSLSAILPAHEPRVLPLGLGLRQSSGAFRRGEASESGRGLPQSKTRSRQSQRCSVQGLNARKKLDVEAPHESPLAPSLSPSGERVPAGRVRGYPDSRP